MARNAVGVRSELRDDVRFFGQRTVPSFSARHRGALVGHLTHAFGSDENRRIALSWLLRVLPSDAFSMKDLSETEWYVLSRWIGAYPIDAADGSTWVVDRTFLIEARAVLIEALKAYLATFYRVKREGLVSTVATLDGVKVIREELPEG